MTQLMTQTEFARHRRVGKPAVSNWKKAGLLVMAEDPLDGRIKVEVTRTEARLNAKLDPMRGRPSTAVAEPPRGAPLPLDPSVPVPTAHQPDAPDLNSERTAHLREQRTGQALKNAQLAGDLVPLVEAERRVTEAGRVARERMQSWLRGTAERFAAIGDVRTIMTIGEQGIDEVFAELAAAAARGELGSEDEADISAEEEAELEAEAEAAADSVAAADVAP